MQFKTLFVIAMGIVATVCVLSALPVFADVPSVQLTNPIKAKTFGEFIETVIDLLFVLGILIGVVMIMVAAFMFVTSGTGMTQNAVQKGKDIIWYVIWGLIILIGAKGFVHFFNQFWGIKEQPSSLISPPPIVLIKKDVKL